jgi:hypothetical protein
MNRETLLRLFVVIAIVVVMMFLCIVVADAQTHTFPGNNVFPSTSTTDFNAGATVDFTGATVTGLAAGGTGTVTSITATTPIIVTPSPLVATGVISLNATSKSNWDTAFSQMLQWDGGATNLVAATGRTSLGLVVGTNVAPATSGSSILYGNGSGGFSNVTVGTGLTFTTGTLTASGGTAGNPTAKVGTSAVNGSASTFMRSDGAPPIDQTIDLGMTAAQGITLSDAVTTVSNLLTLSHNLSTGSTANGFGTGILFRGETSTTDNQDMGALRTVWETANHGTRTSYMDFQLEPNAAGTMQTAMRLFSYAGGGFGSLSVGSTANPGSGGIINAGLGFWAGGAASAAGKILQSGGSSFVASTPTWPTAAGTARKVVMSDGTNLAMSTETFAAPGTAGNIPVSDGTNWTSVPRAEVYTAGSGAGLAACCASNAIVPGSTITIAAGAWKIGGSYRTTFDMTKTAAGVASIIINVHMGTLGTTGDAIVGTMTFVPAGTAAVDSGILDVNVTFKSVGSGTSAVIVMYVRLLKGGTSTGLVNSGTSLYFTNGTSAGFNSTTQTKLSIGFNGGASFSGTNTFAQSEYTQ